MGKFVPIRNLSFAVSKILHQKGLMLVHIIIFVQIFKSCEIKLFKEA